MGWWSNLKKRVSNTYTSVDKAVGGYLPGGVSPGSTSEQSTSSKTTQPASTSSNSTSTSSTSRTYKTSSGATATSTPIPQNKIGGVIVTDLSSGESVTTRISSSGTITSQTYSPAPSGIRGGSSSQMGQSQAISLANREGGLVSQQTIPQNSGQLSPSISAYEYTGQPPQRYNKPLGSALSQSFRNALNVGLIGQSGFRTYINQAFYEPFKYVGQPKAYKTMGYNVNPEWRGTEFGYNMPKEQKQIYTPEGYKDTTSQTYFDVGESQRRQLFTKAGLTYTGESTVVLPQRIQEDVIRNIRPQFQEEYSSGVQDIFKGYQAKVDTGELTQTQAQTQFEAAAKEYSTDLNRRFQSEISTQYKSRYNKVSGSIGSVEAFNQKIFEPPAYPIIRTTGKAIEAGAIIGSTAFGGSVATFAASSYLGYKTAGQTVSYLGDYSQLSTGQKIGGAASIGFGAFATGYTLKLGTSRIYSEWNQAIYSDLASAQAKVRGREIARTQDFSTYDIASLRRTGSGQSLTIQRADIYPTGSDRVGFYSQGITKTKVFNPQTETYVNTAKRFSISGNIPDIKPGNLGLVRNGAKIIPEDVYSGLGSAIYSSENQIKSFNFIAGAKDSGNYYNVVGASSPKSSFSYNTGGIKVTSTTVRGNIESAGKIAKLPEQIDVNFITTSGSRSSQQFYNNLYGVGSSGIIQTAKQAQAFSLGELGSATSKGVAAGSALKLQSVSAISPGATSAQVTQIQEPKIRSELRAVQLPTISQMGLSTQQSKQGVTTLSSGSYGRPLFSQPQAVGQIQTPSQRVGQIPGLKIQPGQTLIPAIPTDPGYFNPPTPPGRSFPVIPIFDINPGGLVLPTNIVQGGRKVTNYSPSYSALVFNIKGQRAGGIETGVGFRPITPGFQFETGLNFNARKMFRRIKL